MKTVLILVSPFAHLRTSFLFFKMELGDQLIFFFFKSNQVNIFQGPLFAYKNLETWNVLELKLHKKSLKQ